MSSFIIEKREYIKAAGIIAGIAEARKLWVFDYQSNRNSNPEDYHRRFTECFEMNALSFKEQYNEAEVFTDGNEYRQTFKEYLKKGRSLAGKPNELKHAIFELKQFMSGAEYQTEKDAYFFKMQMYFNSILIALMDCLRDHEPESWGTLEL